eukprot:gene11757-24656_t
MSQQQEKVDLFLTYDWGNDEFGRSNRARVVKIESALKAFGLKTASNCDIGIKGVVKVLYHAIDNSQAALVFVTRRYMEKVEVGDERDHCHIEFHYLARHFKDKLIPIVLEHDIKYEPWTGPVGLTLGHHTYIDFSTDDRFDERMNELYNAISRIIITINDYQTPKKQLSSSYEYSTSTSTSILPKRSLSLLSVDDTISLFESLNIPGCEYIIRSKKIDGETLSYIDTSTELSELFATALLPAVKLKILLDKILHFKISGVPEDFLSTSRSFRSSSTSTSTSMISFRGSPKDPLRRSLSMPSTPSPALQGIVYGLREAINALPDTLLIERILYYIIQLIRNDLDKQKSLGLTDGIIDHIVYILRRHISISETVCLLALQAIKYLTRSVVGAISSCKIQISNIEGIYEQLITTLNIHIKSLGCVAQACRAISSLSIYKDNKSHFGIVGACNIIVAAMLEHISSRDVSEYSCEAIFQLADDEDNMMILASTGVCRAVTQALRIHIKSPTVTEQCCLAIGKLATYNINNIKLVEYDVCRLLPCALRCHLLIPSIAEKACWAIANLSDRDENRELFFKPGVCKAVISALRAYASMSNVADQASRAIANLAFSPRNRDHLSNIGTCEILGIVLRAHISIPTVIENSFWAIVNLAVTNDIRTKLGTVGICEAILPALLANISNAYVVEQGCWAIVNLAVINNNRIRLGENGACELMAHVMAAHFTEIGVLEQACWAVTNLAWDCAANKARFLAVGIERILRDIAITMTISNDVRRKAKEALLKLH